MISGQQRGTVIWLAPEPPIPCSGGAISLARCVQELSRRYDVELLCLPSNLVAETARLADLPGSVRTRIYRRDNNSKPLALLRSWLGGAPYKVVRSRSAALADALTVCTAGRGAEAIVVEHGYMSEFVANSPLPRILNMQNVESQLAAAEASYCRSPLMRSLWRREARAWESWERRLVAEFDHVTVITEVDRQRLQAVVGPRHEGAISVLERGVDCVPRAAKAAAGSEMLFVGSMAYGPNIDAVLWFCREVLPLVRKGRPQARFTIVGANPPPAVRDLGRSPGVSVTGFVDDVTAFYDRADIAIIPMRAGGGVKMKLLEALGRGMPVVATSAGAAGIGVTHGREVLIADTAREFARCCLDLLANATRQRELGAQALRFVRRNHSWRATGERLLAVVDAAKRDHARRRGGGGRTA